MTQEQVKELLKAICQDLKTAFKDKKEIAEAIGEYFNDIIETIA